MSDFFDTYTWETSILDMLLVNELFKKINREVDKLFLDLEKSIISMFEESINEINSYLNDTMKQLANIDITFNMNYNEYINSLTPKTSPVTALSNEMERVKGELARTILGKLQSGEPPPQITDDVRRMIYQKHGATTQGKGYRAVRIVVTETTRMRSRLKYEACKELRELGYNVRRRWVYTWESIVPRPKHILMDKVLESEEGWFNVDGDLTRAPGLFGIPNQDINCRCDTEIVMLD